MYIVYTSLEEIIVCTPEDEAKTIREYFVEGGRSLEEFDRSTQEEPVSAVCRMKLE